MNQSPGSITLALKLELTNGNTGRGHAHWASSKRRKDFEKAIREKYPRPPKIITPVTMHLTRILGPRQSYYDADSLLRGSAKELIDAIVAAGFLPDDGPKIVKAVTADQDNSRRADGPAVEITITSLEEHA